MLLAAGVLASVVATGCASAPRNPPARPEQVLFVCEHGNVKSLMAASYFNREATARRLAVRAISRGSAPDSTTVPRPIVDGLARSGFDVSTFTPTKVSNSDIAASQHVVLISTELPDTVSARSGQTETWSDVPAASVDFEAAQDALRRHVRRLLEDAHFDTTK